MDAWRRYLPYPAGPSQPSQPSDSDSDSDSSHVTTVTDVTANTGIGETPVCVHRPAGEADDLWARGDATWGELAPERGGHLVRHALDMGLEIVPVEAAT